MPDVNMTPAIRDILQVLHDARAETSGYDLAKITGRKSGTVYPLLTRMRDGGLVERRQETRDEWLEAGRARPIRKYYTITPVGTAALRRANQELGTSTVAAKQDTAIWLDEDDQSSPLTVISGVALTPPPGTHLTLDGADYTVTVPPEVAYTTNDGKPKIIVLLSVARTEPSKGF